MPLIHLVSVDPSRQEHGHWRQKWPFPAVSMLYTAAMKLDHMNICAPGALMEELCTFYCDLLGFEVGPRPDFGIAGYWLYSDGEDRASIHLLESDNHGPAELPYLDHVAFNVASLGDIRSLLDERSIAYGHAEFTDFGLEQVNFLDPAGVKIELNCYSL